MNRGDKKMIINKLTIKDKYKKSSLNDINLLIIIACIINEHALYCC